MRVAEAFRKFAASDRGAYSVEFPIIFSAFFVLVLLAFQIAFAMFQVISDEKAAMTGARIAAVRDPVHTGMPTNNVATSNDDVGQPCSEGFCTDPGQTWSCSGDALGANCDANRFVVIMNDMRRQGVNFDPRDLTITYSYAGMGFAGGPFVPLIRVSIDSAPFLFSFGIADNLTRRLVLAYSIGEDLQTNYGQVAAPTASVF